MQQNDQQENEQRSGFELNHNPDEGEDDTEMLAAAIRAWQHLRSGLNSFIFADRRINWERGESDVQEAHAPYLFQVSVNDPERWTGVLANAENLQKAFGPDSAQIEVVCFEKGLDMLLNTDAPLAAHIATDHAAGMAFTACRNTLRARNLVPADLFPAAAPVDSGVAEIVRKEEAGWAYIKG